MANAFQKSISSPQKNDKRAKSAPLRTSLQANEFCNSPMPELEEMDNFMYVEYKGQGQSHPTRVSSARSRDVETIKFTYLVNEHINFLNRSSDSLHCLDLTESYLFKIPFVFISKLEELQTLILDKNELTENAICKEFPQTFGNCLKEISANENKFTKIPGVFEYLSKLTRLKLANNLISSLKFIEKLKSLRVLVLDKNLIQNIDQGFYNLRRLEYAYLSHNQISAIRVSIKQMVNLKEIDLSYNSIKLVPGDLFLIQNLEVLKLNNNKISKIPKFKISNKIHKSILFVDLSSNVLIQFPDCVMRITEELDVSNNKIRTISQFFLKKMSASTRKKLIIHHNPLQYPPKEISDSGLATMVRYYNETQDLIKHYHGLKVYCLGPHSGDKTKIINCMISQIDDEDIYEKEAIHFEFIDTAFDTNPECKKNQDKIRLTIQIIDIYNDSSKVELLSQLFTNPCLVLAFIDVNEKHDNNEINDVIKWLENITLKQRDIIYLIVGISKRKINESIMERFSNLMNQINDHFTKCDEAIDEIINQIEVQDNISPAMGEMLKRLIYLKAAKITPDTMNSILVYKKDEKSINELIKRIINLSSNEEYFPNVLKKISGFWIDVQTYFEEESYQFPILSLTEFESILTDKFNLKVIARKISNFLTDVGSILYWNNAVEPLNNWVVTNPSCIFDTITLLFDFNSLRMCLEDPNDPDMKLTKYKKKFPNSKMGYKEASTLFLSTGTLLPELSIILFANLIPEKYVIRLLYFLSKCFNLAYAVSYEGYSSIGWGNLANELTKDTKNQPGKIDTRAKSADTRAKSADSRKSNVTTNKSNSNINNKLGGVPPIRLACLITNEISTLESDRIWNNSELLVNKIRVCYRFTMFISELLFQQILVRIINNEHVEIILKDHWKKGIQFEIADNNIVCRVTCYHKKTNDKHFVNIEMKTRSTDPENSTEDLHNIWKYLRNLLHDLDCWLESQHGLWFERLVSCPECNELSFPGTWNIFSNNDGNFEQLDCEKCKKSIAIDYLEPPRLSKSVSSAEVIWNLRKMFHRS